MTVDFTVAIPTYNGEKRLPEVLERLQAQINLQNISWEIIVVDNNSTDNTAKIVQTYQENWQGKFSLRYCFETQQGAAFARKRAFEEAKSELIGFLDDDNIPALDWIISAYNFAQEHPQAGAFGSKITGDFATPPPENFKRIIAFLALTDRGSAPLIYQSTSRLLPPSAGLVVRKQAWLQSVPSQMILTGRTKDNMLTGEDIEMLCYIQSNGWEIWYNPAMQVTHKIPEWRLHRDYLIPFFRGIGLSRYVTRTVGLKFWQKPFLTLAYIANDLRKIIFHLLKNKFNIKNDLVAECEMQLFISSLISPFYLWKNGYLNMRKNEQP